MGGRWGELDSASPLCTKRVAQFLDASLGRSVFL